MRPVNYDLFNIGVADCRDGEPKVTECCPIALSVKRKLDRVFPSTVDCYASVTADYIVITLYHPFFNDGEVKGRAEQDFKTGRAVRRFVNDFDHNQGIKDPVPFQFRNKAMGRWIRDRVRYIACPRFDTVPSS